MNLPRQLIAGIAAAAFLVALGVAVSFWTFTKMDEAAGLRAANAAALTTGVALLSSLQGADADQRGYLLTESVRAELASFIQTRDRHARAPGNRVPVQPAPDAHPRAAATLVALLFAIAFTGAIHRRAPEQLRPLIDSETEHLLKAQEDINRQLQQTNMTLSESEEKLAVTLNSIGDAVIATDAQARVTRLNPVAEELTGWTQAQAIGRPVDEIFHIVNQETRQPATIPVMETLAHGTIQGLANHTLLIARDGSERAIADSCAPIRDRDGRVIGAVLVFRNVTEEYALQQALSDSAALVQTILNTVVDGIVTLRAHAATIETANPAAERMFGYQRNRTRRKRH